MAKGGAKVQQDGELDELSYDDLVESSMMPMNS